MDNKPTDKGELKPTVDKEAICRNIFKNISGSIEINVGDPKDFEELKAAIYKAMDEYAASLIKERDELKERVINLQQADMTHEYNNAEAERVWPQIKQQIIDEAVEEKDKECEYWKQLLEQVLLQMEWGDKSISLEERIVSLFNNRPEVIVGINTETKSIGIMLNSDMQMNGASQEQPNSKEKDDLIKELKEQISTYKGRIERLHQSLEESEKQFQELQEAFNKLLYE